MALSSEPPSARPALPQHLDFLQEPEGPRRRDLLDEAVLGNPHRPRLMAQQRMIEADAVGDLEVIRRIQRDALVAVGQRNRPQHLEEAARRRQLPDTRLIEDQVDERRRAAVHDRHFRMVQLDNRVVDAEGSERGEQVLNGFDGHGLARQAGLVLDPAKMRDGRRNLETPKIASLKPDAVVGGRRFERQSDLVAGMKTDSGAGDRSTEGALRVHVLSDGKRASYPRPQQRVCHHEFTAEFNAKCLISGGFVTRGTALGFVDESQYCGCLATADSCGFVAGIPQSSERRRVEPLAS